MEESLPQWFAIFPFDKTWESSIKIVGFWAGTLVWIEALGYYRRAEFETH